MAKIAELPDGTRLEFPDETPDEVMQAAVKKQLGIAEPEAPETSPEQPRPAFTDLVLSAPSIAANVGSEIAGGVSGLVGALSGAMQVGGGRNLAADRGVAFQEAARDAISVAPPDSTQGFVNELGETVEGATKVVRAPVAAVAGTVSAGNALLDGQSPTEAFKDTSSRVVNEGIGPVFGEVTTDVTGSPELGAAVATIPTAIATLIGVGAANKVNPRVSGLSDDIAKAAKERGISVTDGSPQNIERLREVVKELTADQKARLEVLESVGVTKPTTAQLTRRADDFQAQQEITKKSGPVRERLEGQEAQLSQAFDDAIEGTAGRPVTSGSTVIDEVVNRSTRLDDQISGLYKQARERAAGEANVDVSGFAKKVVDNLDSDGAADGLYSAVRGELRRRGVIDEKNAVIGTVDVATAEEIRKFINAQFDGKNRSFTNTQIRELKDALDTDVFKGAGQDVFLEARRAKASFEDELSAAGVSKFDKNRTSLVRDVLENKVDPDSLVEAITSTKRYRAKHLEELRDYLQQTDEGIAAFDDLRAQVMQNIRDKAFIGPEDANGVRALSRNRLEVELKKVGKSRMEVLFTVEERGLLNRLLAAAKLREPVRGTALGPGPTGQIAEELAGNSLLAKIFDVVRVNRDGKLLLAGTVPEAAIAPAASPLALAAPAAASN